MSNGNVISVILGGGAAHAFFRSPETARNRVSPSQVNFDSLTYQLAIASTPDLTASSS